MNADDIIDNFKGDKVTDWTDGSIITPSPDQQTAIDEVMDWLAGDEMEFALGGLAGTGKTSVTSYLMLSPKTRDVFGSPLVLAPTGKAAEVLCKKGNSAITIHSAIYNYIDTKVDHKGKETLIFADKDDCTILPGDLVVVDESSMVNADMAEDLRAKGCRILWVGDHGQLPPVGKDPGIMSKPDVVLEHIHRQAADNPILKAAYAVREGHNPGSLGHLGDRFKVFSQGKGDFYRKIVDYSMSSGVDQILCGFHKDRVPLNNIYRMALGYDGRLVTGDKIICILNNKKFRVFNGQCYTVVDPCVRVDGHGTWIEIVDGSDKRTVCYDPEGAWGQVPKEREFRSPVTYWDYAYAITVHKSQGSEWNKVLVLDSPCTMWNMMRWRYTAITRAKEECIYVV